MNEIRPHNLQKNSEIPFNGKIIYIYGKNRKPLPTSIFINYKTILESSFIEKFKRKMIQNTENVKKIASKGNILLIYILDFIYIGLFYVQ